jgi:predicted nucleotide-binding protein
MLESCTEQLETEIELSTEATPVDHSAEAYTPPSSNRVFVVHGHDHGVKEAVARFLEKLGLDPVILHEKPNSGRTIIEKFSDYSDVHFAVVLLTGDDEGKSRDGTEAPKPRARQNVILELGYFLGKLSRSRVCALYQDGVEIPSDYQGVLFVPLDLHEKWRVDLVRELKAAGFDVDANKIFSAD